MHRQAVPPPAFDAPFPQSWQLRFKIQIAETKPFFRAISFVRGEGRHAWRGHDPFAAPHRRQMDPARPHAQESHPGRPRKGTDSILCKHIHVYVLLE